MVKAVCPKNIVFTVPDREISKKRLEFQRYLINEYVSKEGGKDGKNSVVIQCDPQRGYITATSSDQRAESIGLARMSGSEASSKRSGEEEKDRVSSDQGAGYSCGDYNLTERFNVNNVELNKRRFNEVNAHILKNKQNQIKLKGARFTNKEISFSLTPQDDDFDKALKMSASDQNEKLQVKSGVRDFLDNQKDEEE